LLTVVDKCFGAVGVEGREIACEENQSGLGEVKVGKERGKGSRRTFEGFDIGRIECDRVGGVFDVEAGGVPGAVLVFSRLIF
jgi:hypothetical protein